MDTDVFEYAGAFAKRTVEVMGVHHDNGTVVRFERSAVTVAGLCRLVSHVPPKVRLEFRECIVRESSDIDRSVLVGASMWALSRPVG